MQTIDSRLIRVFISSTFRDMQDERLMALENCIKAADDLPDIFESDIAPYNEKVGRAYKTAGHYEKANEYFRKAAEKYRELGNQKQEQANLSEIVDI